MIKKILVFIVVLKSISLVAQEGDYINNHKRIYESDFYEESQKNNYLIQPRYSNFIEITGRIESGDQMIVVRPNTILKPNLTLTLFKYVCTCRIIGGDRVREGGSYRTNSILEIYWDGGELILRSSEEKILAYIIYDNTGNRYINRTISPSNEVEVNILELPIGIYYVEAIFEDNTHEAKRFQK